MPIWEDLTLSELYALEQVAAGRSAVVSDGKLQTLVEAGLIDRTRDSLIVNAEGLEILLKWKIQRSGDRES